MLITKNQSNPLGLDISDTNLKFVQLDKKGDKISIKGLGRIEIPRGIIQGGEIKDADAMAEAIKKLLQKPKYGTVNATSAIVSLPDSKTFLKLITLEKGPNKVEDVIGPEIEKHIPLSLKDMYYDWQIIRETADSYEILIGAAPKNLVSQYIECLNKAGLSVRSLEPESLSLCRALLKEEAPKFNVNEASNYALIDIGAKRTSLVIYAKNTIVVSVSLPISGEDVTERISQTLEITGDQAEKAKIICGLDKNMARGIISDILQDMINDLNNKINDSLEYYSNQFSDFGQIKTIMICGGGSNIKNLNEIIKEATGIDTVLANAFANINNLPDKFIKSFEEKHNLDFDIGKNKADNSSVVQNSSLSYASAIGLALRAVNVN